ncbi:MAG: hypothetical protein ACLTLQ_14590 [[Clostridium] scindens]
MKKPLPSVSDRGISFFSAKAPWQQWQCSSLAFRRIRFSGIHPTEQQRHYLQAAGMHSATSSVDDLADLHINDPLRSGRDLRQSARQQKLQPRKGLTPSFVGLTVIWISSPRLSFADQGGPSGMESLFLPAIPLHIPLPLRSLQYDIHAWNCAYRLGLQAVLATPTVRS